MISLTITVSEEVYVGNSKRLNAAYRELSLNRVPLLSYIPKFLSWGVETDLL